MKLKFLLITLFLLLALAVTALPGRTGLALSTTPTPTMPPDIGSGILFDDFSYATVDDETFWDNGWIVREGKGWPGVPGAIWSTDTVTFLDDPDDETNRLLQIAGRTDGTTTYQTEINMLRKFYEGTYAARVYFTDEPASGPDGDQVVETFFMISPLDFDLDPNYSELDYEYLPNGGWGIPDSVFFTTTWETYRPEPNWQMDNTSDYVPDSFEGWHTLVLVVGEEEVNYYIDGQLAATHGDKYYPEVPMSINFNLWFIRDGQIDSGEEREYIEHIDWVYYAGGEFLEPETVEERIAAYRDAEVSFEDTVPGWMPASGSE